MSSLGRLTQALVPPIPMCGKQDLSLSLDDVIQESDLDAKCSHCTAASSRFKITALCPECLYDRLVMLRSASPWLTRMHTWLVVLTQAAWRATVRGVCRHSPTPTRWCDSVA